MRGLMDDPSIWTAVAGVFTRDIDAAKMRGQAKVAEIGQKRVKLGKKRLIERFARSPGAADLGRIVDCAGRVRSTQRSRLVGPDPFVLAVDVAPLLPDLHSAQAPLEAL